MQILTCSVSTVPNMFPLSAVKSDVKRAAADVLYMLGDNSTHTMVMIPKVAEDPVTNWLKDVSSIAACASAPYKANERHHFSSNKLRFEACISQSSFFGDFSPELRAMLWTSEDKTLGIFQSDAVNVVRALLGNDDGTLTFYVQVTVYISQNTPRLSEHYTPTPISLPPNTM